MVGSGSRLAKEMIQLVCVDMAFPFFYVYFNFQENGEVKTFTGNTDVTTVKRNALPAEIYTKAIRFYPRSFNVRIALRVDLYSYRKGKHHHMFEYNRCPDIYRLIVKKKKLNPIYQIISELKCFYNLNFFKECLASFAH